MPYIQLFPIDDQGLHKDRPDHEVKWTRLENVVVRDGLLWNRPGFPTVAPKFNDPDIPVNSMGIPVAIAEVLNPGATNTNRQGFQYVSEVLRPNGSSDLVAGWTGDHTDIDDAAPDDGITKIYTSTEGAQKQLDWGNLTGSIDTFSGILVKARVRREGADPSLLRLWQRVGTTNYLVGDRIVYAEFDGEVDDWETISWHMPYNEALTSSSGIYVPWTASTINSLSLVVELEDDGVNDQVVGVRLNAEADGTDTSWVNYQDWLDGTTTTGTYTDYDDNPDRSVWVIRQCGCRREQVEVDVPNSIYTSTEDARQSFTTEDIALSGDGVAYVSVAASAILTDGLPKTVNVYYYPGGVKANAVLMGTLDFEGLSDGPGENIDKASTGQITENPDTEAAWTAAEINAAEWAVEYDDGNNEGGIALSSIYLQVGISFTSASTTEIDVMTVDVFGADANSNYAAGVVGRSKVWTTTTAHYQMKNDITPTIDDITNSVAVTSPANLPLDHAVLYGQLYVVNGEDATRIYPVDGDDDFGALTTNNSDEATSITGRTVAAFADRIFYGYVRDNTSYIPERVAWSKIKNGTTHADSATNSAGDVDLLDTPGPITKLAVLTEDVLAAYKEQGIYVLRKTGNNVIPFIRDVVDHQTGCMAPMTVKTVTNTQGDPIHIFLGFNPADGYNIFAFDGSQVTPIGTPIAKELREEVNHTALRSAFAEVDPLTQHYYLFVPDVGESLCDKGYSYNIRRDQWRSFTTPFYATAAGIWTLSATGADLYGTKTMIVGDSNGLLHRSDWRISYDTIISNTGDTNSIDFPIFESNSNTAHGDVRDYFTSYMETGDLVLTGRETPEKQAILNSVHLMGYGEGYAKVTLQVSVDGGVNWTDAETYYIGDGLHQRDLYYRKLDIDPVTGRRHRVRIQLDADTSIDPDLGVDAVNGAFAIGEIWLGYRIAGEDA